MAVISSPLVGATVFKKGRSFIENNITVEGQINESSMNKLYQMGEIFGRGFAAGLQKNMPAALDMQGQNMIPWILLQQSAMHLDNPIQIDDGNMPSFPLIGDGNMAYKINRTVTVDGQRKWIRANSEQEYFEKVVQLMGCSTVEPPTQKHPFPEYAQKWFDVYGEPSVATVTALTYQRQINKYLIPHFREKNIEDITTADIQALFNDMGNCAKETKYKVKTVLGMILCCATEDGIIARNPILSKRLRINGRQSTDIPPYTVEQMQFLVSSIGKVLTAQDRAYIALQSLHPMRLEEVLGLKWKDVDLDNNHIYIRQVVTHPDRNQPEVKEPKTEKSVRCLNLSAEARKFLSGGEPDDFVVGGKKPLSYTQVRRMCNRIQKQIGFSESITPIRFRTTVLTDIYDQTKDIKLTQAVAGHATADMTLKHYIKGRANTTMSENTITNLYTAISS